MKRLFTLTLALLCSCLTAVYAADYVGSKPEAGKSYYLLNVAEGKFLSAADNGTLTLGGPKLAVTVTTNANGFQVLTTNKGNLAGVLLGKARCNGQGAYNEWALSLLDADSKGYALGCRSKEASNTEWLYYSLLMQDVRTQPYKPSNILTIAQWQFISEDQLKDPVVTLDEKSGSYSAPSIGSAEVHLKRTFSAGSWNSLCVPFAISEAEVKAQFGNDAKVAAFTGATATTLEFSSCTDIEAGVPYLVYIPEGANKSEFTFKGVTAFASQPTDVEQHGSANEKTTFRGYFHKSTAPKGSYVLRKNLVYHLVSDMAIKGFRAALIDGPATQRVFTQWSLDGTTTGIGNIDATVIQRYNVYNTNGQMVRHAATSLDDLPHGVYIVNGKKVIK
ncbi:hypothetical protein AAAT34_12085 [Hallella faecis]|uniref:Uncharacterized protein n=1 Tax=Hallella faecis TaxID=2841596 RepID=A0ABV1FTM6_9BACT|nr:hypothetical protein [Hallella faecis]MBU0291021.1 hypothetical protein [Hallella faecis]